MDRTVSLSAVGPAPQAPRSGRAIAAAPDGKFAQILQTEQAGQTKVDPATGPDVSRVVQKGDTLVSLVKSHFESIGQGLSDGQAYRQALQVARVNGIDNPNLIHPQQVIRLQTGSGAESAQVASPDPATQAATKSTGAAPQSATPTQKPENQHALLAKTLERAVQKGFISGAQAPAVAKKVLALSEKYKFQPDDFARLTLMESEGMNPRATNGMCHGIIQFCAGSNRGAAAVGLRDNPQAILGMGLLQQLDLVDKYFNHVGLANDRKPVGLDQLYLSVLTPAAREETRPDVPLAIAGRQARELHVGANRQAPITRNSIVQGLHALADRILGTTPGGKRRTQQYAALAVPEGGS